MKRFITGRRFALAALTLAIVAAAALPASAASTAKGVDDQQVANYLLDLEDMPTGWAQNPPSGSDNGPCGGPGLAKLARSIKGVTGVGTVEFIKDRTTGPLLGETLMSFATPKAAKAYMKAMRAQVESCTTYEADGGQEVTISPLSFPKVGDQSNTYRLTSSVIDAEVVIGRIGNEVLGVVLGGTDIATTETQAYLEQAIEKAAPLLT